MHFGSPSDPSRTTAAEAKPRYVYLILKPHGQSSKSPVRPLLREAKPRCVYSILKPHGQSFITSPSRSKAVVCVSTPRMYLRSGYFLVHTKSIMSKGERNFKSISYFPNKCCIKSILINQFGFIRLCITIHNYKSLLSQEL